MFSVTSVIHRRRVVRIGAMLLLLSTGAATSVAADGPVAGPAAAYGRLPLVFEKNVGQTDAAVTFLSRGSGYDIFLTPTEAVLKLAASSTETSAVLRMTLVGASRHPRMSGLDEMQGRMNYFVGRDASRWRTNIATYAKVKYAGVYPGVDLVYYGNQRELEYDLIVTPHTNPNVIALSFGGADHLDIDRDGALLISIGGRVMRQHRPFVYQQVGSKRREVSCSYVLKAGTLVGLRLGAYDTRKALVIDPVLAYSTLLGGTAGDAGSGIAVDAAGNIYVAGVTQSIDFPTLGSPTPPSYPCTAQDYGSGFSVGVVRPVDFRPGYGATCIPRGAVVWKLNPTGSVLLYTTFIGGTGQVRNVPDDGPIAVSLALDAGGSVYITGTAGSDFPTTVGAFRTAGTGAFVAKLNPAGGLVYSTYLGPGEGVAIAVDLGGNAFVTGKATGEFPTTSGAFQPASSEFTAQGAGAYVAKLNPTGTGLLYATMLGHSWSSGIAVDGAGSAYVTGSASAGSLGDFPTTEGAFYRGDLGVDGGAFLPFVTKLNPTGTALEYSTLLGPMYSGSFGIAIAVDAAGNAFIASQTWSFNFPTTPNALQPGSATAAGRLLSALDSGAVTVTKLNATGSALIYSTYLSDRYGGYPYGIAVDGLGSAYVTGLLWQWSLDPLNGTSIATYGCGYPYSYTYPFVAKLNPAGSAFSYLAHAGGISYLDTGTSIALDAAGTAYVTGVNVGPILNVTIGCSMATTPGAFQEQNAGGSDAFVWKVTNASAETAIGTNVSVYPGPAALTFSNVASAGSATVVTLDPTATANFSLSDNLAAYDVSTTATYSGPITLCFPVTGISDAGVFNNVTIMHVESGVPVDRTSSRDFVNRTVCATVTTLSPFVIVKGAIDQLNALVAVVRSFNLQRGIENSLDAKLQNAQNAVTAVKAHDKTSACNAISAFLAEVQAQAGKSLTQTQAGILKAGAGEIRTVLGCR